MIETKDNLRRDVERLVGQAVNLYRARGEAPRWTTTVSPLVLAGPGGKLAFPWSGDEALIAGNILQALERGEGRKWQLSTFVYSRVRFALLDLRRAYTQGGLTGKHDSINRSPGVWEDGIAPAPRDAPPDLAEDLETAHRLRYALPGRLGELMRFLLDRDYDFLNRKSTPLLGEFAALHKVTSTAVRLWYREALAHPALKRRGRPWRRVDATTWVWLQRHLRRFPTLPSDVPTTIGDSHWPIAGPVGSTFLQNGRWQTVWTVAALRTHPGIKPAEDHRRARLKAIAAALPKLRPVSFDERRWRDSWADFATRDGQLGGWEDDGDLNGEDGRGPMHAAPNVVRRSSDGQWRRNDYRKQLGKDYVVLTPVLLQRNAHAVRKGKRGRVRRRPGGPLAPQVCQRAVQYRVHLERLAASERRRAWFAETAADETRWRGYDAAVRTA